MRWCVYIYFKSTLHYPIQYCIHILKLGRKQNISMGPRINWSAKPSQVSQNYIVITFLGDYLPRWKPDYRSLKFKIVPIKRVLNRPIFILGRAASRKIHGNRNSLFFLSFKVHYEVVVMKIRFGTRLFFRETTINQLPVTTWLAAGNFQGNL